MWIIYSTPDLCAGMSGNRTRQECVTSPTVTIPHVREYTHGDMGHGMDILCCACVFCLDILCMCG